MISSLTINQKQVNYRLNKSKRARRVSLRIHSDASVVLTYPPRFSDDAAKKFLVSKTAWIEKNLRRLAGYTLLAQGNYQEYKTKAEKMVLQKIATLNVLYGFKYNKISIRNQSTKWGSCSAKGNLNFNYKIVFLPDALADYLIVHELCHLKHLNHSSKFWHEVARTIPDFQKRRQALRKFRL